MGICIDWFKSPGSTEWQNEKSVGKLVGEKKYKVTFFDFLYLNRGVIGTGLKLIILTGCIVLVAGAIITALSSMGYITSCQLIMTYKTFIVLAALNIPFLIILPSYVIHRFKTIENINSPFYQTLANMHQKKDEDKEAAVPFCKT